MHIFTPGERERLRAELVSAAQSDPNLAAAANTGSAASDRLDRWSDIDIGLCLKPDAARDQVIANWSDRLYGHGSVTHTDIMRGPTLFRVFLLENTLQVDIAFWDAADFGPMGPNFKLIFGETQPPRPAPQPDPQALIGMAWLYALHIRSSIARGRILQADYMLSGMRNHVFELMCLRCGVVAQQGRGLDDLPPDEQKSALECIPRSLGPGELKRAFQRTTQTLRWEIGNVDAELESRLSGPLNKIIG